MAIGMKQTLKLSQSLVMTPQLQQAIKLLQLSRLELENLVTQEMIENPVLEDSPEHDDDEVHKQKMEEDRYASNEKGEKIVEGEDSFDWQSYVESYQPVAPLPISKGEEGITFENVITRTTNLQDHLMWQLQMTHFTKEEERMCQIIIGNLNEDGYLNTSLEELAAKEGFPLEDAEAVLKVIQEFDPVGVGSRDLKECLLVQAKQLDIKDHTVELIIKDYLHHLEKKNYVAIAKALDLPMERVVELSKIIFEMEPKPGRSFSSIDTHYITPDVYVYKMNDQYVISLNEDGLPRLKISNFYKNALQGKEASSLTKEYIQDKLRSAVWLIRSIHQRQRTIYKVTESIVKHQLDFLEKGLECLKPMVLRDVAQDIGMHESTVSRVTTNKYVHTPQGIFELKYFFNSSIGRMGDVEVASESVKDKIKKMVASEDVRHPHSDQKIVEMLQADGINIARRTVAKYREMLNILPSSKRKKFF
ncbi:MAG: RNA polymerase factor sigma-54 [Deltaproteobacteria bacterium]|nr:RNA polymerase factor sigma-54 [Deltaproteobacteria bacterium]